VSLNSTETCTNRSGKSKGRRKGAARSMIVRNSKKKNRSFFKNFPGNKDIVGTTKHKTIGKKGRRRCTTDVSENCVRCSCVAKETVRGRMTHSVIPEGQRGPARKKLGQESEKRKSVMSNCEMSG